MKAILMSIKECHNRNIESGLKTLELRKRIPKCGFPIKVYTYESGFCGRHKVTNEWICRNATEWRICMGIPVHLVTQGCVSVHEIREYSGKNYDNIFAMEISDLQIYDEPKELGEFTKWCRFDGNDTICNLFCPHCDTKNGGGLFFKCTNQLTRAPQSWCYVEEI